MASERVHEFTGDNFEAEVINADVPVVVDFWAEWCQPCRMIAPIIDELAEEYGDKLKVGKVDTDGEGNRDISIKYRINAIPTVFVFKGGELVEKFVGMTSKQQFKAKLDALV